MPAARGHKPVSYALACAALGLAAMAPAVAGSSASGAAPDFLEPIDYTVPGAYVDELAVGDLNRDGRSDVLGGGRLLLAGQGGRLSAPTPLLLQAPVGDFAISDVNGDGNRDVVEVWSDQFTGEYPNHPAGVTVLWGDGRGAFPTRTTAATRCCPTAAAAGEFSGDHKRDLAVVTDDGTKGWLLVGDGSGGFTAGPPNIGYAGFPIRPVVADLNADRKDDVAVLYGAEEPHDVTIQLGDGKGGFSRPKRVIGYPMGVGAFALGRFNRDRWTDLAAIALNLARGDTGRYHLHVFLGTPRGPLRPGGRFGLGRHRGGSIWSWGIVAADFTGDGKQDLAVTGPGPGAPERSRAYSLRVLPGTGRGSFGPPRTVAVGRKFSSGVLALGLFNRDRKPDLAVGWGRNVSILLNTARR